jgi:ubiquinone/menaquinone biosynthesis C-methylase UbiE
MANSSSFYEKYWKHSANVYSGSLQGYAVHFRRWMNDRIAGRGRNLKILEVGCGDATFTRYLTELSDDVTAVDIAEAQLTENAKQLPKVKFQVQDLSEPMPFPDATFDVIWCSEVLEHLMDPTYALSEMRRVLKPGGIAMVTVPYHGFFKNLCIVAFRWERNFDPEGPHIRYFTKKTLERVAKNAGFKQATMKTCGMSRPFLDLCFPSNILMEAK